MEQKNKNMQVLGRIIGLTQPAALNCFCLTSPVISSLADEFLQRNNIGIRDRKHHYQSTGSICERIHKHEQAYYSNGNIFCWI